MSEDVNSNQPAGSAAGDPGDALTQALEALAAMSPARTGRSPEGSSTGDAGLGDARRCPEPGEWIRLAGGGVHAEENDALLAHAAVCGVCLARLRESQRLLSQEASPEETEALQQFASATPQWQHRLAVELALTPRKGPSAWRTRSLLWASAGLAAALIVAFSTIFWWRYENAPERLLAEAYTHDRTFDLRIPGATFAPVKPEVHLRGAAADNELPQLLAARAEIERKLEQSPNDPRWLQLEARAELLGENYDPAIDILDRLLAAGPVTPSLLMDDASAYFQRGTATGSENDRATALDDLRRADELAPGDPVILFNEALVMEDRGQMMNAVETWNRYLKFEHDPNWQEEGRQRLKVLEAKLEQLKTHQSRMEEHLATPRGMRALAADPATLAGIDEELSSTFLPQLLEMAFPPLVDRSRGSPCPDKCQAARVLLHSLADSLERNHQDPWLAELLPSDSSPPSENYRRADQALGRAIDADTRGSFAVAERWAFESRQLFAALGNAAGEDRAEVERVYALQRSFTLDVCQQAAEALIPRAKRFAWITADATTLDAGCDMSPGASAEDNPISQKGVDRARAHHYVLLELRGRNSLAGVAVESGDAESAWRICMGTLRRFYAGDYPPFRAATTMSGLALVEVATPRVRLDYLANKEALNLFALAQSPPLLAEQRVSLIGAAIRAGALKEAAEQMALAQKEIELAPNQKGLRSNQSESEILMAGLYLDRGDLADAAHLLEGAHNHMVGEDNPLQLRNYAVVRGELELALGHPETAESSLRAAILEEEREAPGAETENIVAARGDRELYAALAGVWVAEKRPGIDILALWERYRLRILGEPVPACDAGRLDCLRLQVERALKRELEREFAGNPRNALMGQIVLRDRVLLYRANAHDVAWSQVPSQEADTLAAAASLERVDSSPATSQASVDQAARRLGNILMGDLQPIAAPGSLLVLEPDPLLGNVPWPSVETAQGPIGLDFDLEEAPSLVLDRHSPGRPTLRSDSRLRPLVVGASVGAGESELLPEALTKRELSPASERTPRFCWRARQRNRRSQRTWLQPRSFISPATPWSMTAPRGCCSPLPAASATGPTSTGCFFSRTLPGLPGWWYSLPAPVGRTSLDGTTAWGI